MNCRYWVVHDIPEYREKVGVLFFNIKEHTWRHWKGRSRGVAYQPQRQHWNCLLRTETHNRFRFHVDRDGTVLTPDLVSVHRGINDPIRRMNFANYSIR